MIEKKNKAIRTKVDWSFSTSIVTAHKTFLVGLAKHRHLLFFCYNDKVNKHIVYYKIALVISPYNELLNVYGFYICLNVALDCVLCFLRLTMRVRIPFLIMFM